MSPLYALFFWFNGLWPKREKTAPEPRGPALADDPATS
jgi:hypothetical protein